MPDLDHTIHDPLLSLARTSRFAIRSALLTGALLVAVAGSAHGMCDPDSVADSADIAAARAAVAAACDCSAASTHGSYVKCAVQTANETLVNRSCAKYVKTCASHSTCGKPGFVSCCAPTGNGGTKCKATRDVDHCTAKGGVASECSSCCDACPAPGSGLSCSAPPSTTTTLIVPTTTTAPPTTTVP